MEIRFWGVRGSVPSPLGEADLEEKIVASLMAANGRKFSSPDAARAFLRELPVEHRTAVGGNTPCVEVKGRDERLIVDAGSGIKDLGALMVKGDFGNGAGRIDLLLSHTHWDHIQGFPFFAPVYVPGNSITIWGVHPRLRQRLKRQHHPDNFPVPLEAIPADLEFRRLAEGKRRKVAGFSVTPLRLLHPGEAFAFRIEQDGATFIYASDGSYAGMSDQELTACCEFYANADLLVFDAHFALVDSIEKSDWGHSSSFIGVDIALRAGVKRLLLFHHDPYSHEDQLVRIRDNTLRYLDHVGPDSDLEIELAREGLEITI